MITKSKLKAIFLLLCLGKSVGTILVMLMLVGVFDNDISKSKTPHNDSEESAEPRKKNYIHA